MTTWMMTLQARPLVRAQLRSQQARPVARPACSARNQLARVGAPGLALLERGVHLARVGPSPRCRRALITEATKKSVGDLSKAELEGKVVLVSTQDSLQIDWWAWGDEAVGQCSDMLFHIGSSMSA